MEYLKRAIVITMAILVFGVFGLTAKAQAAETYMGDFCWEVDMPVGDAVDAIMKLSIYEKDGGQFALFGSVEATEVLLVLPVLGNAVVSGDKILLNALTSHVAQGEIEGETGAVAEVWMAELDSVTLSGAFHGLSINFFEGEDDVDSAHAGHDPGTLTFITCP